MLGQNFLASVVAVDLVGIGSADVVVVGLDLAAAVDSDVAAESTAYLDSRSDADLVAACSLLPAAAAAPVEKYWKLPARVTALQKYSHHYQQYHQY